MKHKHQVLAVLLGALLCFSSASIHPATHSQAQSLAAPNQSADENLDAAKLTYELHLALQEIRPYDSIRIVSQLGQLGSEAIPAVEVLIDLLGKQLLDCSEKERVCPDKTQNCSIEKRICPEGVELQTFDYLTPYAFTALKNIGVGALPGLSRALDDESSTDESRERRQLVAGVMGAIGPDAIPFISGSLCTSNYSKRVLALGILNTVVSQNPSANQLSGLVPCITPFLSGNPETIDQAINILGAIGPDAAAAVPQLIELIKYERVLGFGSCPVGERVGYIFRAAALSALSKIGTPQALKTIEEYKATN